MPLLRGEISSARDPKDVLSREERNWDDLATLDPLWAILSNRRYKFGRWETAKFLANGDRQVQDLVARARLLGRPREWKSVLDFGCGVGRLAPALSSYFDAYCGLDLSPEMVRRACELHGGRPNCRFLVNHDATLEQFQDQSFDLACTFFVLQHLTDQSVTLSYIRSLFRLVRVGGLLAFQLPTHIPKAEKAFYDVRRGLFLLLGRLGVPRELMFRRLGLFPMTMGFLPERLVVGTLQDEGAKLLRIDCGKHGVAIRDRTYYFTRES
jgi:SAM-dependent methyltransferase